MLKAHQCSEGDTVRFYERRGSCACPELSALWSRIKVVDEAQEDAKDYAEQYVQDPPRWDRDPIFMRALQQRINSFGRAIEDYGKLFAQCVKTGQITFLANGVPVAIDALQDGVSYQMQCSSCGTEVPRLEYPGWNE